MSIPRYSDYKDSGVAWLGEVPGHWEVFSLKRDLAFLTSGSRGWAEHYADDGPLFIRIGNLTRGNLHLDLSDIQRVAVPDGTEGERTKIFAGDVLFSITAYLGSVAIAPEGLEAAYISQHVALARLRQKRFLPSWVGYTTLSVVGKTYLETQGYGGTKIQLGLDDIANLILTVPPLEEQSRIIAFLDGETAKIDALVVEQERLIELLKEKRQAVISHAVTKGLNPDAPMKDSGIEWLGEVPDHWKVGKCGFYLTILAGFAFPSSGFTSNEDDVRLLRGINVGVSQLKWEDVAYWHRITNDGLDMYEVQEGDLILGMDRPLIAEGMRSAIVKREDLPCLLLQRVASLRTGESLSKKYLFRIISSKIFVAHFSPDTTGVSVPHISPDQISNFIIPIPPIVEQSAIVAHLDRETVKLDALVAEAQHAIDLLKERRAALISAAVTGQIDVRGLVADNHAPAERVPA